jgi:hypothetical protein
LMHLNRTVPALQQSARHPGIAAGLALGGHEAAGGGVFKHGVMARLGRSAATGEALMCTPHVL